MIKAPIAAYWAVTTNERVESPYFAWVVVKYVVRGISTLFLMGLLLKVDARSLPQKNRGVQINHFLVPAIMLAISGAFLESLIDQYAGPLDSRLRFVSRCNSEAEPHTFKGLGHSILGNFSTDQIAIKLPQISE